MTDLTAKMDLWRNGVLSNSEMLQYLMGAMDQVVTALQVSEERVADERMKRLREGD